MEEMKNNQTEEVVEQRPSTKYGRTAYQEQLRREQEENAARGYAAGDASAQNPYGQEGYAQNNYSQNPYQQDAYQSYTPYQEPKIAVKNTFAYILMVLVAVSAIVNFAASMMTMDTFNQIQSIDVEAVLDVLVSSSAFNALSYAGDMVFCVSVVFFVLDIMALYKAKYKITGAILFAILLRPAYFIWRAHLLGQKKTVGIIYTVCYYGFCLFEYATIFMKAFEFAATMV